MAGAERQDRLPAWLLLGAPKCGTTAFAGWLGQHPGAYLSAVKELYFFDDNWNRGLSWYSEQFASGPAGALAGEATPSYLYSDVALDRIAATVPEARLLVLLREPVRRAWSQYMFTRQLGNESRSFAAAVQDELDDESSLPWPGRVPGYVSGGAYAGRIRAVHDRFGRESLLVLFQEELTADPLGAYALACRHIGLDPGFVPDQRRENPTYDVRSLAVQRALWALWRWSPTNRLARRLAPLNRRPGAYQAIHVEVAQRLREIYADDAAQLAGLIGRRLPEAWGVNGHSLSEEANLSASSSSPAGIEAISPLPP